MLHEGQHRDRDLRLAEETEMVYSRLKRCEYDGVDRVECNVMYLCRFVRLVPQEREQMEGR